MSAFAFTPSDTIYQAEGRPEADPQWSGALRPFAPVCLSPAAALFSYGLGVFEGLKAHAAADGRVLLFRPQANARRLQQSAEQLLLLPFPESLFLRAVVQLVQANRRHLPALGQGALYLRPVEVATEPRLGIAPCQEFRLLIYAAPVGDYFSPETAQAGLSLRVLDQSRVPAGGSGAAKAMGNYAGCLRTVHHWRSQGYHDVLFLDAQQRQVVTETSGSNLFARLRTGELVTPALDDQVLPGITRDSVIRLARDKLGWAVQERPLPLAELLSDAEEVFCTGTAYTVQPVGTLTHKERQVQLPGREASQLLKDALRAIQQGSAPDPWGWTLPVPPLVDEA